MPLGDPLKQLMVSEETLMTCSDQPGYSIQTFITNTCDLTVPASLASKERLPGSNGKSYMHPARLLHQMPRPAVAAVAAVEAPFVEDELPNMTSCLCFIDSKGM